MSKAETPAYPNYVFADTHPGRLAGNAIFFGMSPANVDTARVLEIGCGGGLNCLSQAVSLPNASFLAIDISEEQIKAAEELRSLSNVKNVEFRCQAFEDLHATSGYYDYIICHGLFSWVAAETQQQILKTIGRLLSRSGIAYVSYNVLPGWHLQRVLRDAMRYHNQASEGARDQIDEAKEFLRLMRANLPQAVQPSLGPVADHLLEVAEEYLFHDHLSEENNPVYFHQMADWAKSSGLMYLAESDLSSMLPREISVETQEQLQGYAEGSLNRFEQYCDFLRLRTFRKTLFCRNEIVLQRTILPAVLLPLWITARRKSNRGEYLSKGSLIGTHFEKLDREFPRWLSVQDFIAGKSESEQDVLLSELLDLVGLGRIELRSDRCRLAAESSRLEDSPQLVQVLAHFGNAVPNLRGDTVALGDSLKSSIENHESLTREQYLELARLGLLLAGET